MNDIETLLSHEDVTYEETAKFFSDKIPMDTKRFFALLDEYKAKAFTVSGYTKLQIIKKFQEELLLAIEQGETVKSFSDRMNNFLDEKGYKGITNFQAENIFRTNIQTAYQVGHYKEMTDPTVLKLRPYWMYDAVNDEDTRPSHMAMDSKVFPADSPIWDVWYPPNGFKCRCTVQSLSKRQVEQRGLKVETDIPKMAELKNGQVVNVLPDPSFASNPAKVGFKPDLKGYPDTLKKIYENKVDGKNK